MENFAEGENIDRTIQTERKDTKPEFALDGWQYRDRESVTTLINRVSQQNPELKPKLETALAEGGGKAFGLKICEMVARNFTDPETLCSLTVPEWKIVFDINEIDPVKYKGIILRSSTDDEDWIDPASGVHASYKLISPDNPFPDKSSAAFKRDRESGALFNSHYIEQPIQEGFGLVVDVGYSEILGKPVVRMCSGNLRGDRTEEFTSAVSDTEAAVGAWDSEGRPVTGIVDYRHRTFFDSQDSSPGSFAKGLVEALRKTGINFGVQVEIVVNPANPKDFRLIQLRPTPENITKTMRTDDELVRKTELGIEGIEPRSVFKTASVNGKFDVLAGVSIVSKAPYVDGLDNLTSPGWDGKLSLNLAEKLDTRRSVRGGIAICSPRAFQGKYADLVALSGIYLENNADVLITPTPIKPNNTHGAINDLSQHAYCVLDRSSMISVTEDQCSELERNSREGRAMQVISDGLIADVRIFDQKESPRTSDNSEPLKDAGKDFTTWPDGSIHHISGAYTVNGRWYSRRGYPMKEPPK
ncbi:hypothetical protein C4577_07130 [Candidatus Parcubacteria bacterium]|nr:MAG: hypothetical protein C4577_07130 [Candidatus Parcubacteria bacterium]